MTVIDKISYGVAALFVGVSLIIFTATVPSLSKAQRDKGSTVDRPILLPILPNPALAGISSYGVVLEKPIFVPTRKPPPLMPIVANDESLTIATASAPFSLVGVVIMGDKRSAVLKHTNNQEMVFLHNGQSLDGWTVDDIKNNGVRLHSSQSRLSLHLADDKKSDPLK